jgi:predicted 3-demethylubiquinone-9 3-methyltransferase (glyoxalase superfamily)
LNTHRYSKEGAAAARMPEGTVMTISFKLRDQEFVAINAGPIFKFNESISFVLDCESQEEVDYFWDGLCDDVGEESMCGWLKDKYGLSWQVVPRQLNELLVDKDPAKAGKAMKEMLKMKKIIIADLI